MRIDQHIQDRLSAFIAEPADGFETRFEALRHPLKQEQRALLIYIDRVLELMCVSIGDAVNFEHLHLEGMDDASLQLIGELLIIRCHFKGLAADKGQAVTDGLAARVIALQQSIGKELRANSSLSGKSAQFRKLKAARYLLKRRQSFLKQVMRDLPEATMQPRSLLNVLKRDLDKFKEHPGDLPYVMTVEQFSANDTSYVLLNKGSFEGLAAIKHLGGSPLKAITDVYLFDAEGRTEFGKFNTTYFKFVNNKSGCQFRSLVVLSVNEGSLSFSRLKVLQERTRQRYHVPVPYPKYGAYTVLATEIAALMGRRTSAAVPIELIGPDELEVWNDVIGLIDQFEGVEELKSAKFLDLYALVIDAKLKAILLNDIFGGARSQFLSEDAYLTMTTLSKEQREILSTALGLFLDWSIGSIWPEQLRLYAEDCDQVVISPLANTHVAFNRQLRDALRLSGRQKFLDRWQFDGIIEGRSLLLDYYDLGPIPDTYAYNVLELKDDGDRQFVGLFLNVLFGRRHRQARYELDRHLTNILEHPIRSEHFDWGLLHQQIRASRPAEAIRYYEFDDWYEQQPQQSISIKLGDRTRTFPYSELFVIKGAEDDRHCVKRIGDIDATALDRNPILAQCLTDLYVDFNIYGRLVNAAQQAEDLRVILQKFNMPEDMPAMRLWKELLAARVGANGLGVVYRELTSLLQDAGKQIVDKGHFLKNWAAPESASSLPRGRVIFRTICAYLELPASYQRIAVNLYNQEKLRKIRTSRQMNVLLRDLINDGCFDDGADVQALLNKEKQRYLRSHDLESNGIAIDKAVDELSTLVELLRPQLALSPVIKINLNQ
ncbi:hypothetical protein [Mucilaginibacter rubeus]|uniref:Uncharacterized protein n=1 Tax=Mucilaginibacter rubeus TaxID=2027860 RepID=A0A5C1HU42_9SPHI|nr:hypothetical protein [Mucilaginibacter rubeus]QEM09079.1 hypothetical protein DEO27_003280 [Mucilaginibacter rubeus]